MKYNKKLLAGLLILTLLFIVEKWWHSFSSIAAVEPGPKDHFAPPYEVKLQNKIQTQHLPGTVVATLESNIMAQVLGTVTQVYVYPGKKVQKGELLIELDARDYQSKVDYAKQKLFAQESNLKNLSLVDDRMKKLLEHGAIAQAAFDTAHSEYLQATANFSAAQEVLVSAEIQLGYCQIRAPDNGMIINKLVSVGDQVGPLARPLLTFQSQENLQIQTYIPEALSDKIKINQTLSAQINNKKILATITEITPQINLESRSLEIKLNLPPENNFYLGSFANVEIPILEERVIAVPENMIEHNGQLDLVYIETPDGRSRVMITTGEKFGNGLIEVLSGLNEGDRLLSPEVEHGE